MRGPIDTTELLSMINKERQKENKTQKDLSKRRNNHQLKNTRSYSLPLSICYGSQLSSLPVPLSPQSLVFIPNHSFQDPTPVIDSLCLAAYIIQL